MSTTTLINDVAHRIFTDHCAASVVQAAEDGVWPLALHEMLRQQGLLQLGLQASGAGLVELFEFLRVAGRHAVPLPLLEWLLAQVALGRAVDATTLAVKEGQSASIAWPEQSQQVLLIDADSRTGVLHRLDALKLTPLRAISGEPVALIDLRELTADSLVEELLIPDLFCLAALGRVAQMCGALERSLELALQYATEREQFGRPIAKFQAIQHQLAVMAAEVAASQRATDAAIAGVTRRSDSPATFATDVAVAKVRVGAAVGVAAEIAHQVHGAMGFTMEHQLHHFTRRMWAWRDDFGTESEWAGRLGAQVCAAEADDLWEFITSHG